MGHSTAVITVSTERAEQARKHVAASRVRNSWFRPTFASEMVDEAVRIWRDEDAGRDDNSRAGNGFLTPVMLSRPLHSVRTFCESPVSI